MNKKFSKNKEKRKCRISSVFLFAAALLVSSCGSSNGNGGGGGYQVGDGSGVTLNYDLNYNSIPGWMGMPVRSSFSPTKGKTNKVTLSLKFNLFLYDSELGVALQTYRSFVAETDVVISGSALIEVGTGLAKLGTFRNVLGSWRTPFSVRLKAGSKMPFLTQANENYFVWSGLTIRKEVTLLSTADLDASDFSENLTIDSGTISGRLRWSTENLGVTDFSKYATWVNDNADSSAPLSISPSNTFSVKKEF